MSTTEVPVNGGDGQPRYRRKLRNYLIDVGLQIRYTAVITGIALTLTAVLGYQIIQAARDTSIIIQMTGLVDPAAANELQQQFAANDRRVLLVIVGFGFLLVLSTMAVGIWITHKVAGPLYSIEGICARVRDNKLHPSLRQKLRKGDELKDFYSTFREMYEALRTRADRDMTTLNDVIARLERGGANASPEVVEVLRKLRAEKAASLEP
jgi:nitrogen fixation/metabolism regulation signal transduction histidine kinase